MKVIKKELVNDDEVKLLVLFCVIKVLIGRKGNLLLEPLSGQKQCLVKCEGVCLVCQ